MRKLILSLAEGVDHGRHSHLLLAQPRNRTQKEPPRWGGSFETAGCVDFAPSG